MNDRSPAVTVKPLPVGAVWASAVAWESPSGSTTATARASARLVRRSTQPRDDRGRPRRANGLIFIVPPIVKGRSRGGPVVGSTVGGRPQIVLRQTCESRTRRGDGKTRI